MVQHEAQVLDISQSGLCLILDRLPPTDRALWIGIGGSNPISWSQVILKSLSELDSGQFLLRLSFVEDCPYDLFKHAVLFPTGNRDTRMTKDPQE
jgi:hypothetical protein